MGKTPEQSKLKLFGIDLEVDISEAQLAGGKNGDRWHVDFAFEDCILGLYGSYDVLVARLKEALVMLEDVMSVVQADAASKLTKEP